MFRQLEGAGYTGAMPTQTPAGAELIMLEPVRVFNKDIGRMIGELRKYVTYFQIGPRDGNETIFYVLPDERLMADHLAIKVSGPLAGSGCNPKIVLFVGLPLILFIGLAFMASMVGF